MSWRTRCSVRSGIDNASLPPGTEMPDPIWHRYGLEAATCRRTDQRGLSVPSEASGFRRVRTTMAPKYARKALEEALASSHVDDKMLAVGLFAPKGSGVGMLAGGLVGDVVGGGLGGAVGSALGDWLGSAPAGRWPATCTTCRATSSWAAHDHGSTVRRCRASGRRRRRCSSGWPETVSRRRSRTEFRFGFWSFRLPATPNRSASRETETR